MRIYLSCGRCLVESGRPSPEMVAAELEESGLYRMKCGRGHETVTCLQQMKFEVLFDLGANAIVDGYYREAVGSFAAALERLYEFYIQFQNDRRMIDPSLFESTWKSISNLSERQLGAFIFLYLLERKTSPPILTDKAVKFRNSVIHKGRFPSREAAIGFGEEVADLMVRIVSELQADSSAELSQAVGRYVGKIQKQIKEQPPNVSLQYLATMICLGRATTEPQPKLRDWIQVLEKKKVMFAQSVVRPVS